MSNELRNFLSLSYAELEEKNLSAKAQRISRVAPHKIQEERLKYLTDTKEIKAVTVLFSDLEGRLHMLDYDKKFLIRATTILRLTARRSVALPRSARATFASALTGARFTGDRQTFLDRARFWYLARSSIKVERPTALICAAY